MENVPVVAVLLSIGIIWRVVIHLTERRRAIRAADNSIKGIESVLKLHSCLITADRKEEMQRAIDTIKKKQALRRKTLRIIPHVLGDHI